MTAQTPAVGRAASVRVAIGTHSGVRVSEHFGQATRFEIWEVRPDGSRFMETRLNRPACGSGCERADEMMDASVAAVADCRAVVVARIGDCALTRLDKLGILAFETDDPVDATVRQLADYAGLFEREKS